MLFGVDYIFLKYNFNFKFDIIKTNRNKIKIERLGIMRKNDLNKILDSYPHAFAYHKILNPDSQNITDYTFISVNKAFEEMTGLSRENIIKKRVSEVLPDIKNSSFGWIETYNEVAKKGQKVTFKKYSEPLNEWYEVNAFSHRKGYFYTIFRKITEGAEELTLLDESTRISDIISKNLSKETIFSEINESVKKITKAKYVALNLYDSSKMEYKTISIAGIDEDIEKIKNIIGVHPIDNIWNSDIVEDVSMYESLIHDFKDLNDYANDFLGSEISQELTTELGIGKVYVKKIINNKELLGSFIIFMNKKDSISNLEYIDLISNLTGQYLNNLNEKKENSESKMELQSFLDIAPNLLCVTDIYGNFIKLSKSWIKTLGYTLTELQNKSYLDLIHPDDIPAALEAMRKLKKQEKITILINRYRASDGSYKWIEWKSTPKNDYIYSVSKDISDRMNTNNNNMILKKFIEKTPVGIFTCYGNGSILNVNERIYDQMGYSHEEMQKLYITDFLDPKFYEIGVNIFNKISHEKIIEEEVLFKKKNKESFWVRLFSTKINDDEVLFFTYDITKEKKTIDSIVNHHDQMLSIFDNIQAVVYVVDMDNYNILFINRFGKADFKDINDKKCWEILHPEEAGICSFCPIPNLKKQENENKTREKYNPANNKWYQYTDSIIKWNDGKDVKLSVAYDITDRKEAEKENKFISSVMMNSYDAVIILNDKFNITYVNQSAKILFGVSMEELIGLSWDELYSPNKIEKLSEKILSRINLTNEYSDELEYIRKDNTHFICDIRVTPIIDSEDVEHSYICILRDITKDKQNIEELELSNKRYNDLAMQSRTITWTIDANARYTYISPVVEKVLGFTVDELIGKVSFQMLFAGEERTDMVNEFEEIFSKKAAFVDFINTNKSREGESVTVKTNGIPIYDENGDFTGYNGTDIDITEQFLLQKQNYFEKQKFQATLLSVGDGIIATDNKQNITVINNIAEYLTGWTSEEAVGRPLSEVFQLVDESTGIRIDNPAREVLLLGETIEFFDHTSLITRDGKLIPIEDSAAPIKGKNKEIEGVVIVFRDYTEKREKQKEVEYLSFHDQLTGLYNRRYMEDAISRLDSAINLPLAVTVVDINGLKLINDAYGQDIGDSVLKKVADILREVYENHAIITRTGGDEFTIINLRTDEKNSDKLKKRIISKAHKTKVDLAILSLAVGYAVKSNITQKMIDIIKEAENRMYKDKIKYGKTMRSQTIELVMRNLNSKYDREQIHTERVSLYCESIAREMGMEEKEIDTAKIVGALHDIGKITISPDLLNKKEKLTDEEWIEIKKHPASGYSILKGVEEYASIAKSVLHHHERWDGKGYPEGLKSKDIPIYSRIVSVADAFEAMTAKRPYRKTMSIKQAIDELKNCSGTQFDEDIVKIFIKKVLEE